MKKKLLVALALAAVVLGGCGTGDPAKDQISASEEMNGTNKEDDSLKDNGMDLEENVNQEISEKSTEFSFGNNGEIAIIVNNEQKIMVYVRSNDAEECSLAFAYYYSSLSDDGMSDYDTSILCSYGDGLSVMWNKTDSGESIVGINSDGSSTSELPDWIITDTEKFTLSETEQADILSELQENTLEFLQ